jgi:hypothetical protein
MGRRVWKEALCCMGKLFQRVWKEALCCMGRLFQRVRKEALCCMGTLFPPGSPSKPWQHPSEAWLLEVSLTTTSVMGLDCLALSELSNMSELSNTSELSDCHKARQLAYNVDEHWLHKPQWIILSTG